jgi:hypothetical protein
MGQRREHEESHELDATLTPGEARWNRQLLLGGRALPSRAGGPGRQRVAGLYQPVSAVKGASGLALWPS